MKIENIEDIKGLIEIVAGLVREGVNFTAYKMTETWTVETTYI